MATTAKQYSKFWDDLFTQIEAEIPLVEALEIMHREDTGGFLNGAYGVMIAALKAGVRFSEALKMTERFSSSEIKTIEHDEDMDLAIPISDIIKGNTRTPYPTRANEYLNFYWSIFYYLCNCDDSLLTALCKIKGPNQYFPSNACISGNFLKAITNIRSQIDGGKKFSALMRESGAFSEFDCAIIEAGEAKGNLARAFQRLFEHSS